MNSIWLQLSEEEIARLRERLAEGQTKVDGSILNKIDLLTHDQEHDEAFREAMVEKYAGRFEDGALDAQPDGLVSKGEDGAYVMAFLYVTNAEAGLNFDEDMPDDLDNGPE